MTRIPQIRNETNSRAAWATLARLFEGRGNTCRLFLKNRLHDLKLKEGGSLSEFIIELQDIANKFSDVREPVPNPQLVEIMWSSLLKSYATLV